MLSSPKSFAYYPCVCIRFRIKSVPGTLGRLRADEAVIETPALKRSVPLIENSPRLWSTWPVMVDSYKRLI